MLVTYEFLLENAYQLLLAYFFLFLFLFTFSLFNMTHCNMLIFFIIHNVHSNATQIYLKYSLVFSLLSLIVYSYPVLPDDFKFWGYFGFFSLLFPPQASSFHHLDVWVSICRSSVREQKEGCIQEGICLINANW